jgi:UDP-glucose 4-epimerase
LRYLRGGGEPLTLNCGYGRGFSVLEVIDAVKRVAGRDFRVEFAARRRGDPARIVAATDRARERSAGVRNLTTFRRSSRMHWHGSASFSPQTG